MPSIGIDPLVMLCEPRIDGSLETNGSKNWRVKLLKKS